MAGFPKYPVPRYLQLRYWIINRHWKSNAFHFMLGSALLFGIMSRFWILHVVHNSR